jgi:ribosome-associated heat shock protein Hsp15
MKEKRADNDNVRIDKWLWAARFFKTRSLAADAVDRGRVRIGGEPVKPARAVKVNDKIFIDNGSIAGKWWCWACPTNAARHRLPRRCTARRKRASPKRENDQEARRCSPEPGSTIKGRPTKRDRRAIEGGRDNALGRLYPFRRGR